MKHQSSVLKTDEGESPPRVRIPVPPPFYHLAFITITYPFIGEGFITSFITNLCLVDFLISRHENNRQDREGQSPSLFLVAQYSPNSCIRSFLVRG